MQCMRGRANQSLREKIRNLTQVQHRAASCRTFDSERAAEVLMELSQAVDYEEIHRHPNGSAPVGITAEQSRQGLAWCVVHAVLLTVQMQNKRIFLVIFGQRSNAVLAEELVWVQHLRQNFLNPTSAQKRNQLLMNF